MSARDQLSGLADDISAAYSAVAEMGGQVSEEGGSSLLPSAIRSIPQGASEAAGVSVAAIDHMAAENVQTALEEIAGTVPVRRDVTLTAAGWAGTAGAYTQTVDVEGVRADEAGQLVRPVPRTSSREAWDAAGIKCTAQGAGTLTFAAKDKPAADIAVYVILQEVLG